MTAGTKQDPWVLTTPPGTSRYTMYRDEHGEPPALVCQVGSTTLKYHLRAIEDLHAWLAKQDDWVPLGAADEKKPAAPAGQAVYRLSTVAGSQVPGAGIAVHAPGVCRSNRYSPTRSSPAQVVIGFLAAHGSVLLTMPT